MPEVISRPLKVLVAYPQGLHEMGDACAQALAEMGHQVREYHYLRGYQKRASLLARVAYRLKTHYPALAPAIDAPSIAGANRALLRAAAQSNAELVLIIKGEVFFPQTLARLRRPGRLLVNWAIDDPFRFENVMDGRFHYDRFFCFDPFYVARLHEDGVEAASYLPLGYDHQVCTRIDLSERERKGVR